MPTSKKFNVPHNSNLLALLRLLSILSIHHFRNHQEILFSQHLDKSPCRDTFQSKTKTSFQKHASHDSKSFPKNNKKREFQATEGELLRFSSQPPCSSTYEPLSRLFSLHSHPVFAFICRTRRRINRRCRLSTNTGFGVISKTNQ